MSTVRHASRILGELAAFWAVAWAILGLPLLLLAALVRRSRPPQQFVRSWLLTWGPMLALGFLHVWTSGSVSSELLLWPLVAIVGGLVVASTHVTTFRSLLLGLCVITLSLVAEQAVATTTWSSSSATAVSVDRFAIAFGPQTLQGPTTYERVWRGPGFEAPTIVTLDLRLLDGAAGWSWYTYDPGFVVEPLPDAPSDFARITPPDHGGSYVTRRIDTGESLAGRTFRVRLRVRAAEPFESTAGACRGVLLREVGGAGSFGCFATSITTEWSDLEFTWRAPDTATSTIVRVELRMPGPWFDVGAVQLEEATSTAWRPLGPLEPAGVRLTAAVPGAPTVSWITSVVVPTPEWQSVALHIDDPRIEVDTNVRVLLRPEAATLIQVRNVAALVHAAASTAAGPAASTPLTPMARPQRRSAWFEHPNLAGHSLVMAGLMVTSAAPTPAAALAGIAMTLAGVGLTGSRTAWLVALLGLTYLLWSQAKPLGNRLRLSAIAFTLLAAALLASWLWGSTPASALVLGRDASNEVPRLEILSFAWRTMLAHPLQGIGDQGFHEHWAQAYSLDTRIAPRHAHNFWLHYGAQYGLPGFLVAIWLGGSLLHVAHSWAGRRLVLVGGALLMQTADFTLPYVGVYVMLLLAFEQVGSGVRSVRETPHEQASDPLASEPVRVERPEPS